MNYAGPFHITVYFKHSEMRKASYNSNHIEGSKLSEDQTRLIFETKHKRCLA